MMNICIFVGICFFAYLIFRNMNNNYLNRDQYNYIEGMTTSTDVSGNQPTTSVSNGVAGNAAAYAAQIKSQAIKIEDQLLLIDDYIFLCFLLGNDFLEHVPSLIIKENGLTILIKSRSLCMHFQFEATFVARHDILVPTVDSEIC